MHEFVAACEDSRRKPAGKGGALTANDAARLRAMANAAVEEERKHRGSP